MESLNPLATSESFDELDDLLALIFPPQAPTHDVAAGFLADVVDARLANLGWSADVLATELGCDSAFIAALLAGCLAADQLEDEFIVQLAGALDYAPNLLRIVLGRSIAPTLDTPQHPAPEEHPTADVEPPMDYLREIGLLLERIHELTAMMLQEAGQREALDPQQLQQYDFVLQQIETIVSKQRADSKLRLDIRRIIHFIQDAV